MLNKDGIRELVYVARIAAVRPIEGKDRVECAVVGGWTCMVPKGAFQPGDLGVYHEIDSKCPEKEPYLFLEKRHYKVKTQKFKDFYSQGLLMPASDFGWEYDKANDKILNGGESYGEGHFLTESLGVKYYDPSDNKRKAPSVDKYKQMAQRMGKKFSRQPYRWLMQRMWGKKLLFFFFGRKSDKKNGWPAWVQKTDEERAQNLPMLFPGDATEWIVTEKLDGTSTTFTLIKTLTGFEYKVCSRNVCFDTPEKADNCFYESNYYLEMSQKYDMRNKIEQLHKNLFPKAKVGDFVTVQGETFGAGVQKRDYGMKEREMRVFNLIFGNYDKKKGVTQKRRFDPIRMKAHLDEVDLPSVPIIDTAFKLPQTCEELLKIAEGASKIDGGMREGLVFRTEDGERSFKAVSNPFLAKYHG